MFLSIIAFPIRVAMSQEIMLMQSAWGQRCCPCPQHSPSEQHMLTMISKDVCWAVSKAVASLSSSLPLWTKTSSHVSQHLTKTTTVSTVITQSSAACHKEEINFYRCTQTCPVALFEQRCKSNLLHECQFK